MHLESLQAFVAFADAGCNLTVAGRAIGLSQPAMHARLQSVGRAFGISAYERRGRRLALTPAGVRVLGWARDVLERERALRVDLSGGAAEDRVILACGEGALVHVVAARVAAFLAERPGALSFLVVDAERAVEAVRRGDSHLAVIAGPAALPTDLKSELLVSSAPVAIAPRRHPAVRGATVQLARLLDHPLVVPPLGRPLRAALEEGAASLGRRVICGAEVTGWEAVARLSALGVGVGIVNDVVTTPGLQRAIVRDLPATTYRLLSRRGRPTRIVSDVVAALVEARGSDAVRGRNHGRP